MVSAPPKPFPAPDSCALYARQGNRSILEKINVGEAVCKVLA